LLQAVETQLETDPAAARRHLHRAQQTARENLAEARSLVAALAPPHLQTAPLADALARLVERTGRELDLAADFAVDGSPVPMPARTQVVLLRATQEALTNVGRHAAANRVRVRLGYHDGGVSLDICDDGRGFDASAPPGFGLDGMRRRVRQVGGALRLTSAPGTGTAITIEVPASGASAAQPTGAAGPAEPAGGSSPAPPTSGASPVGPAGPGRNSGASPVGPAGPGQNGGASPVGPAGQGRNGGGG
jgi:signal transduction histidine kinase